MVLTIARPSTGNRRFFPLITPELYRLCGNAPNERADQWAAHRLLDLGNQRCTLRQRFGLWLSGPQWIRRLLYMHRLGLEAELSGRFVQADFYWSESRRSLRVVPPGHSAWASLASILVSWEPSIEALSDPHQLRQRLVEEILLDTHCAFYNGQLTDPMTPDSRAFDHIDHLKKLLSMFETPDDVRRALVGEPILARVDASLRVKQFDEAIRLVRELVTTFPTHLPYQDKAAGVFFSFAVEHVSPDGGEAASRDEATTLARHIENLTLFHRTHPYSLGCFDALARLYHIQALKLTNGNRHAQALHAIELALAYKPAWQEALESQKRIESILHSLHKDYEKVLLDLDGVNRRRAGEIAARLTKARARDNWLRLGLPVPPEEDRDKQAECLLTVINLLRQKQPADALSLAAAWYEIRSEHPELGIDQLRADVIERYFLGRDDEREVSNGKGETFVLASPLRPRLFSHAPFDLWLVSAHDIGFKLQTAAALVLLALGLIITQLNSQHRNARDLAFVELREATNALHDQAAVAAAERFLVKQSWFGRPDSRLPVVLDLKRQFADWANRRSRDVAYASLWQAVNQGDEVGVHYAAQAFRDAHPASIVGLRSPQVHQIAQDALEWPNLRKRDAAYDRLVRAIDAMDDQEVLLAAEQFLRAPPLQKDDVRSSKVKSWYSEAFTHWFVRRPEGEGATLRLDRYRELMTGVNP